MTLLFVPNSAQTVHILNSGSGLTSQIAKYNSKIRIPSIQLTTHRTSKTWLYQDDCLPYTAFFLLEDSFSLTQIFPWIKHNRKNQNCFTGQLSVVPGNHKHGNLPLLCIILSSRHENRTGHKAHMQ